MWVPGAAGWKRKGCNREYSCNREIDEQKYHTSGLRPVYAIARGYL
jgi:hypothetical protein